MKGADKLKVGYSKGNFKTMSEASSPVFVEFKLDYKQLSFQQFYEHFINII